MGVIRPKKCEGRELTKDQLAGVPGRAVRLPAPRPVHRLPVRRPHGRLYLLVLPLRICATPLRICATGRIEEPQERRVCGSRYTYLNTPSSAEVTDFILEQFQTLHADYIEARRLIPQGQLVELPYAELEADKLAAVRRLYRHFDWGAVPAELGEYAASLGGYRKNRFVGLPRALKQRVARAWRASFEEFGYEV